MATHKLTAAILVLSLLLSSTLSNGCCACKRASPPPAPPTASCPRDTLKLGACAALLGAVNVVAGSPPYSQCCGLLSGLGELEAALCLCTAIKANVLGIVHLNWPTAIELLLSQCKRSIPAGFKCA